MAQVKFVALLLDRPVEAWYNIELSPIELEPEKYDQFA